MKVTAEQAYSILGVVGDCVLNKDGSVTIAYLLKNPEPYSLDDENLRDRLDSFYLALKDLNGVYYHKQDAYIKVKYDPSEHGYSDSFLSVAEKEHFRGREYLKHYSVVSFTLIGLESLDKAYQSNPLSWNEHLLKSDFTRLDDFLSTVENAIGVLKNVYQTSAQRLSSDELKYYLFEFVNGFNDDGGIRDIKFNERFTLGTATGSFFSISDENFLPESYTAIVDDNTINSPNAKLSMGRFDALGINLHANHVINQIIFFEGNEKLKDKLRERIKKHGQFRRFTPQIQHRYDKLVEFENEIIENNELLVRVHFNIMLWDEDFDVLQEAEKEVKKILKIRDFKYYIPSYEGLYNIFLGSVIGRNKKLSLNFFFVSELALALTLSVNYSPFQDDPEGVLFTDRIFQIPKRVDLWSGGSKKLPARNAIVFASTGGGKSATTQTIVQQFLEQGVKTIVVEFGSSFKALAQLYKDKSALISYRSDTPLGINPFHLNDLDTELTPDKIQTLSAIVLKYWRIKLSDVENNQLVALQKIIRDYYGNVSAPYNFPAFYNYVKDNYQLIIERLELPTRFFDVESFLHVCSEFMPNGIYENVSAPSEETERMIRENDFIVFELTAIKKDPFLVSIVMTALFDTIENKILSDRSTKGVLIFDEYAETQSLKDMFSGEDIHSTVAFAYQKFRKENGAIYTIVQSPVQLPDNEYTKGIIANTQLLYVLPTTETVYDAIVNSFTIKNQAHINLMKSISWDYETKRPYNEVFIRFMDKYAVAHKIEFSREKYYTFQTDGEKWNAIQKYYQESGDFPRSIYQYMLTQNEKVNPKMLSRYAPDLKR
jgi:hypothetical protein